MLIAGDYTLPRQRMIERSVLTKLQQIAKFCLKYILAYIKHSIGNAIIIIITTIIIRPPLCLVARVLGYRSGDPGSIPGTTRFSEEKKCKQ
jgi:hypothetical protein